MTMIMIMISMMTYIMVWRRLLTGIGIPSVGEATAARLSELFDGDFASFWKAMRSLANSRDDNDNNNDNDNANHSRSGMY